MGRLKIKKRVPWQRVTNALVIQFANPDCIECKGAGVLMGIMVGGMERKRPCPCCDSRFKAEYAGRLRRMKNGALEYRALAVAAPVEDAGPAVEEVDNA